MFNKNNIKYSYNQQIFQEYYKKNNIILSYNYIQFVDIFPRIKLSILNMKNHKKSANFFYKEIRLKV